MKPVSPKSAASEQNGFLADGSEIGHTCMVFATRVAEGIKDAGNCPQLTESGKADLSTYMDQFELDI